MINTRMNSEPHTPLKFSEIPLLVRLNDKIKELFNSLKPASRPLPVKLEPSNLTVAEAVKINRKLEEKLAEQASTETELRQANQELQQAIEKEKKLHALKTKFLSMASHEFRTPLTTVMMATDMLETYGSTLSSEQKEDFLERIKVSAELMTELMNEILQYTRIENGSEHPVSKEIELPRFCSELLDEIRLISGAGYNLIFLVQQETGCTVFKVDPLVLRQILTNLLSNAIKYSPKGGTIKLSLQLSECQVTFEVKDQGIGIPEKEIGSLFEAFKRGENVRSIQGTGLGLAIVKKCVDLYGGSIGVKSKLNRGSTFTVDLPLPQGSAKKFHFTNTK